MSSKYYDWNKTFSYDAELNMIVTARGRGKTYGLRKQCVCDYLNNGKRFAEIVRYNNEISSVAKNYFSKLELKGEFPGYMFKFEGNIGYIAKVPEKVTYTDKDGQEREREGKPEWDEICYIVDLYRGQKYKKQTFVNVRRVIFDEFILKRRTYPGYLDDEYGELLDMLDTLAREEVDEDGNGAAPKDALRVYLLANACDIVNPYFQEFGITDEPDGGYRWVERGEVLLHFEKDRAYSKAKLENTVVGRLGRGRNRDMIENVFGNAGEEFIEPKPKDARFQYGFTHKTAVYGVWVSTVTGVYYVNGKIPRGDAVDVFSLTTDDNKPNYIMARRNEPRLQRLVNQFYKGNVRYDTPARREQFLKVMNLYGVR